MGQTVPEKLLKAVYDKDYDAVSTLLAAGANPLECVPDDKSRRIFVLATNTPVFTAAMYGDETILEMLIDNLLKTGKIQHVNEVVDPDGMSLLHLAAGMGEYGNAKLLLEKYGADPLLISSEGNSPIFEIDENQGPCDELKVLLADAQSAARLKRHVNREYDSLRIRDAVAELRRVCERKSDLLDTPGPDGQTPRQTLTDLIGIRLQAGHAGKLAPRAGHNEGADRSK